MKFIYLVLLQFIYSASGCNKKTAASTGVKPQAESRTLTKNIELSLERSNKCGDDTWVAFKDTKCFKFINELVTRDTAYEKCSREALWHDSLYPPLLVIQSEEEHEFAAYNLFNRSDVVNNVWLGARRPYGESFRWDDGSQIDYSNWADANPSRDITKKCMELIPKNSNNQSTSSELDGKWRDVACSKRNLIVCQKLQTWTTAEMQKTLLHLRDAMRRTKSFVLNQQEELKRIDHMVRTLKNNPVPIGFVYVQLYGQPTPDTLWPGCNWSEISSSYSGQFFRVIGGNAASFGTVQSDFAPRITYARSAQTHSGDRTVYLNMGGRSAWLYSGDSSGNPVAIDFETSSGEVRPINQAMRLWKRTS